ncbi:MAG TPA: formimidoylglutamate deiminase [Dermatophilaceae bacterium]|nr:formimidoylglutamate deiminase [Dermatophilaceae bacterium]
MTSYWCERAALPAGVTDGVRLRTREGRLTAVETGVAPAPSDTRLRGLVLPGLANAHSHAFHRVLRGRTHDRGGTFWTWRQEMYAVADRLTPDTYLGVARALLLEALCAGWTVVGEFQYLHHGPDGRPYADPNAMGRAVVRAAEEVGIRLTLLDTCYLAGGLGASGPTPLVGVQRRFGDGSVSRWAERVRDLGEGPLVRVGAAAHSVRVLTPAQLADLAELVEDPVGPIARGRPVHAHVSEQPAENEAVLARYAATPSAVLGDAGLLGDRFTAVHATHLTADDVALLARSGATACFCPTTEADLADGIGPARVLHDAGVPLALGSDSHAVVDPFREMQALEMHDRLAHLERGRLPLPVLRAAASGHGYHALGWPDGGRLEAGALADLVAVDPASRRTAGSDPEQVALTAAAADVTDVVVGGRHVVRDRQHELGPVEHLLAGALDAVRGDR